MADDEGFTGTARATIIAKVFPLDTIECKLIPKKGATIIVKARNSVVQVGKVKSNIDSQPAASLEVILLTCYTSLKL